MAVLLCVVGAVIAAAVVSPGWRYQDLIHDAFSVFGLDVEAPPLLSFAILIGWVFVPLAAAFGANDGLAWAGRRGLISARVHSLGVWSILPLAFFIGGLPVLLDLDLVIVLGGAVALGSLVYHALVPHRR